MLELTIFLPMIEIPADIQILATIDKGSVYYFEEDGFTSKEPHYFVVLNEKPKGDSIIILACATSKVGKRKGIAKWLGFPPETLVEAGQTDYPYFKKPTIFDCNNIIEKTKQAIIDKLAQGKLKRCSCNMPNSIVDSLVAGVLASPQVPEASKVILRIS